MPFLGEKRARKEQLEEIIDTEVTVTLLNANYSEAACAMLQMLFPQHPERRVAEWRTLTLASVSCGCGFES